MKITKYSFIKSSSRASECPKISYSEFAFIGRSNVGKSSLINTLVGNKKLAKTSSTPGKTLLINHFLINENWYLVDLPGFGYAKTSKKDKKKIEGIISDYFLERKTLQQTYLLVDIRLKPQQIDLEFMIWLNKNNIFFKLIFTKSDKLNKTELDKNPKNYLKILQDSIGIQPEYFLSSSKSNYGKNEILNDIENEIKT